jgi:hypothetical protein
MTPNSDSGIVTIQSHHSVDQTVQKLEGILQAKGVRYVNNSSNPGWGATCSSSESLSPLVHGKVL